MKNIDQKIEITLRGGLGNQLFMLFGAMSLAQQSGRTAQINLYDVDRIKSGHLSTVRNFNLDRLPNVSFVTKKRSFGELISENGARRLSGSLKLPLHKSTLVSGPGEPSSTTVKRVMNMQGSLEIVSYLQSSLLLQALDSSIFQPFFQLAYFSRSYNEALKWIRRNDPVSIHLRRGDYASTRTSIEGFGLLSFDYYKNVFSKIDKSIGATAVCLFTDDENVGRELLRELGCKNAKLIGPSSGLSDEESLLLMRESRRLVIANSSFSWWGGWTSKAEEVHAPAPWFKTSVYSNEIVPPNWQLEKALWVG